MNAPGRDILKVVSIVFIVMGAFFALLMIMSLFVGTALATLIGGMIGYLSHIFAGLLFVVFLIPAAADLIIGIIGIKKAGNPSKAMYFIVTGIIMGALALIVVILAFNFVSLLGLVLPVLYIIGGTMNRKAAARTV